MGQKFVKASGRSRAGKNGKVLHKTITTILAKIKHAKNDCSAVTFDSFDLLFFIEVLEAN